MTFEEWLESLDDDVRADVLKDPEARKWHEELHLLLEEALERLSNIEYPDPMLPPWQEFPGSEWPSMQWTMGGGEDYWRTFWNWLRELPPDRQNEYRAANPEPQGWEGVYDFIMESR